MSPGRPSIEELLARARKPSEEAMRLHPLYRGKMQTTLKCPIRGFEDFAIWYTPGVAAPCRAIQADPDQVYAHTSKGNTIAIVTDGTRVLGLGDIGPEASLPVMEGKALLFKYLGGVDAVPLGLATRDPDELIRTVQIVEPAFGGINLEDIAQPKCFRILGALRSSMAIPVWHDDQQGTATALLAGLINALEIVGKAIERVKIVMVGVGAANVASYRLLTASGADPRAIIACDRRGALHGGRQDIETQQETFADKWRICRDSNGEGVTGGPAEAFRGADVCVAFSSSGPGIIDPRWVRTMARDPIVFACANPIPEIWPWDAHEAGARIVATGRSDFPNQLNNSLVFPGLFRGVLDVRARSITDEMQSAVAHELARFARERGIREDDLLPRMDEWEVHVRVAVTAATKAQEQEVARLRKSPEALHSEASMIMRGARETTHALMREGLIAAPPAQGCAEGASR